MRMNIIVSEWLWGEVYCCCWCLISKLFWDRNGEDQLQNQLPPSLWNQKRLGGQMFKKSNLKKVEKTSLEIFKSLKTWWGGVWEIQSTMNNNNNKKMIMNLSHKFSKCIAILVGIRLWMAKMNMKYFLCFRDSATYFLVWRNWWPKSLLLLKYFFIGGR